MFKILLVNPPREHVVKPDLPGTINVDLGEISSFPPMGLMYLAQAVRQHDRNFSVKILDAVPDKISYGRIAEIAFDYSPQVIGITAHTYTFYDVWKTASELKKRLPGVPIVIGGSHMYIFPRETMTHNCFDFGVSGDGEDVFSGLCGSLYKNIEIRSSPGLFIRKGDEVTGSGTALVSDLDLVKLPAIDLIDHDKYYSTIGQQKAVGTICSSRGCPFRCTFCQVPKVPFRTRSIKNVILEIKEYGKAGVDDFFFFDDLFNMTKGRVVEFCNEVLDNKLKIGFMFRGRIDQIDDEMLELARKAGCHSISVGIEDATDEGLKAIKKNITIKQAFDCVRLIRKYGIRCSTNWIIGFPHHKTAGDLEHLLNTAIKMDSDYAQFSVLQCLPGSEIYEQAVREKGIDPEAWRSYVLNPVDKFEPLIWEKHFTKAELFKFYEHCYKKYYFRLKVFAREMLNLKSADEFLLKVRAFKTVFFKKREEITRERVTEANRIFYDAVAEDYEKIDGRRNAGLMRWLRSNLEGIRKISPGGRLLDIGSGSGLVGRCAEGIFEYRAGIDVSKAIVDANRNSYDFVIEGDLNKLPFESESFDVITCFAVLHHLHGFESLVSEVSRVLKPGGVFYADHDMDKKFSENFYLPLAIYRRLKNAKGQYGKIAGKAAYDTYDYAEWQADGIKSGEIVKLFREKGFSVSVKYHWYGLSFFTDIVFSKMPYPRGFAPVFSIQAVKTGKRP